MTRFSLLTVHNTNSDGTINGGWVQDHIGTLRSAKAKAARTSDVNSGWPIAVVAEVPFCDKKASIFYSQVRLA